MKSEASQVSDWHRPQNYSTATIAVIGGGFYGCVTALKLADIGMKVVLFEQNNELFRGCSGTYGLRLQAGPHYPRSPATRHSCQAVLHRFIKKFPSLVVDLEHALYAIGIADAEGLPARVSSEQFDKVCRECDDYQKLNPEDYGLTGVHGLWSVYEPCLYQSRVRDLFANLMSNHKNITCVFNHRVSSLQQSNDLKKVFVDGLTFDWVVNCTYFRSFISNEVSGAQVKYQPCLTLIYEDLKSNLAEKPFTLTIMDGWFPCLMPMVSDEDPGSKYHKYMLYHAKYTILGSYDNFTDCEEHMKSVRKEWVEESVRPKMESHFETFLPGFRTRFRYTGYLIDIATKLRTATEFRGALVWRNGRIIHQFSGKITESISAADETLRIIQDEFPMNLKGKFSTTNDGLMKELSSACSEVDGACEMGVHRWD